MKDKLYVDGKWVDARDHEAITDPFSGETIADIPVADEATLELATQSAVRAFGAFRKTSRHARYRLLRSIHAMLAERRQELAELIMRDAGKPVTQALGEVDRAMTTFELAAHETYRFGGEVIPVDIQPRTEGYSCSVERFPIGPIAAITPFNFPLNLLAHKIAPCLAVGSTMVVKAPPQAPLVALELAGILEDAGVPPGVFNVLHMPIPLAEKMVTDERYKLLSFTGSAPVGWHLKSVAGKKRVLLELGGNAGVLVHEDADIDAALGRIVVGSYAYAGQVCIKVQRVFAHRSIYAAFTAKLAEATSAVKAGDPKEKDTVVGPVIDRASFDRVMRWVAEAKAGGAKVLAGGGGEFPIIQPTLLETENRALKVHSEEVFGPITVVAPYDTWEQGLALLDEGAYGLQAGVFTHDIRRVRQAFNELEVGGVVVNDVPTVRVDNYPYGGVKDSGLGREGVRYAMDEMTEPRVLLINEND